MIRIESLSLRAGSFALDNVNLAVPEGAFAVLMGRTGCGKTTLIETVCGLRPPLSGRIVIAGRDVTRLKPAARGIGFVPQDGALFTTMTVREHLAFALRLRRRPRREIAARIEELAADLGIAHLLGRRPAGLSGGEAQRVALGRALAFRPRVFCLDEPLSALDHDTRLEIGRLLKRIQTQYGATVLQVTHDRAEAVRLGDLLFVMRNGRVEPAGAADVSEPDLEADA